MSEKLWYLKNCKLFEQISDQELRDIERSSKAKTFPRNGPIYLPADGANSVLLLASGRAKICNLTAEGKQSILAFIEPGELFGELALVDPGVRDEYAEAVERSTAVQIPAEILHSGLPDCGSL